jgi:hypothetical protein
MPPNPLVVLNGDSAQFECTFGRGCEGVCCRDGRPAISGHDARQIDATFPDVLALLRKEACRVLKKRGYLHQRGNHGHGTLRVVRGWCIFFNKGCALQRIGEARGSKFAYQPLICAVFPLARSRDGSWYVRQKGNEGETWDLFCLAPGAETPRALETLKEEIALAARIG